jgi:hypothetical protein
MSSRLQHWFRRSRPTLIAIAVLTALWLLFFWRILTPSTMDRLIFQKGDFTQHYYAFASYQVERLWQGEFPLWNPYNYAGDSFVGNVQFSSFYPPRWLAALFLGQDGFSIEDYQLEVALHYWLASVLMFAFLHAHTRRTSVAITGAVLYAYSGYLTGYPLLQVSVLESVIWLPLMMLGVHHSANGRVYLGSIVAGVGMAFSLFGGHPQTTMQLSYLTLLYLAYLGWKRNLAVTTILIRVACFVVIGVGLSAIQLLPSLEFTRLSYRVTDYGYIDKANGFAAQDFFQIIAPGHFGDWSPLYIGIAGLLLGIGGLLNRRTQRTFWLVVIVVGLFLSLGGGSIVYAFFYLVVPGFNVFRQQERAAAIVVFAWIVLACEYLTLLLDSADTDERSSRIFETFMYGLCGLLFAGALLATFLEQLQPETVTGNLTSTLTFSFIITLLFVVWYRWQRTNEVSAGNTIQRSRDWLVIPLVALLVVDLFTIGSRSTNYVPDTPENRVQLDNSLQPYITDENNIRWRVDGASGLQGDGVYHRISDIYGTGPFTLASMELLRQIPVDRFWEVLSVRYITSIDPVPETIPLSLLAYGRNPSGEEFQVLEILDPRPMAQLVYDYRHAEGSAEFARQIMSDPRIDLREMAVTVNPLPFELPVDHPEVSRIDSFEYLQPEHLVTRVSTGADALLTVSMVNYPGWQAEVNGQPVEIVDVYAGLIGIPLRAGEDQEVILLFRPTSLRNGALISGITMIGILGVGIYLLQYNRRRKST